MWSWILHRGTGLMVLGFLFLHILDTSLIGFGKEHYDRFVGFYKTALFRPLEVLLVFLTLGHLAIMHVLGGGVERVSFDFVAARWHGMFWRTYDWLLLSLAIVHGANGARVVIDDYVHRDGWRALLKTLLLAATFLFLVLGTFVIVTFNPGTM